MTVSGISLVDAFLAGFAMGFGLEVVSFDADLTSFAGLSVRLLAK